MLFQIGLGEHQDTHKTGDRVLSDLNQRFSRAMHRNLMGLKNIYFYNINSLCNLCVCIAGYY